MASSSPPPPSSAPTSVRLPILEALSRIGTDVDGALKRQEAYHCIRRFVAAAAARSVRSDEPPRKRRRKTPQPSILIREDALFLALRSTSAAERAAATKIWLAVDNVHTSLRFVRQLAILLEDLWQSIDISNEQKNQCTLEWTALWKHFLLLHAAGAVTHNDYRRLTAALWKLTGEGLWTAAAAVADLLQHVVLYSHADEEEALVAWRHEHWFWTLSEHWSPMACLVGVEYRLGSPVLEPRQQAAGDLLRDIIGRLLDPQATVQRFASSKTTSSLLSRLRSADADVVLAMEQASQRNDDMDEDEEEEDSEHDEDEEDELEDSEHDDDEHVDDHESLGDGDNREPQEEPPVDAEELCADEEGTVALEDQQASRVEGFVELDEDEDDEAVEIELAELEEAADAEERAVARATARLGSIPSGSKPLKPALEERKRMLVEASMQVLALLYPHTHNHGGRPMRQSLLTFQSEMALLAGMNQIVKPPKKPLNTKIIMRRAPTQEEFFRGNLSRNPIPISILKPSGSSSSTQDRDSYEPTVADLRQHIANDLQMSDSAELIEILVANKILDVNLKLRVVHQVVWRNHLIENAHSTGSSLVSSAGGGLSMIFSTGLGDRLSARGVTAETPLAVLPAMIATYRLAGVDGEATEDTVNTLVDPEAPDTASAEEQERMLEKEYGLTRTITSGRGIFILMRSIQNCLADTLRRIRRDAVDQAARNASRVAFKQSPPCAPLTLLLHCSRLSSNRKLLLQARAPTILLTLLLDVLKVLEQGQESTASNPTAKILQELIEVLTSDISTSGGATGATAEMDEDYESDAAQDAASMPLLLESIETISLSPPLRQVIAKLLPFLTYGQMDLSRTLAKHFDRNIPLESLPLCETEAGETQRSRVLTHTFVQTAISLPPNEVCNSLRSELIHCGFVERVATFITKDMPKQPPSWSPALWSKGDKNTLAQKKKAKSTGKRKSLEDLWKDYYGRDGVQTAFKILTGLAKRHSSTQARLALLPDFVLSLHWLEATSDNTLVKISTNGLGLLAETLLDELMEGNDDVTVFIDMVRKKTRMRKRELAEERRAEALNKIGSFAGSGPAVVAAAAAQGSTVRGTAASILAPVFGLFSANPSNSEDATVVARSASSRSSPRSTKGKDTATVEKPSWLDEMEAMEDDVGLTCAVCQEGRTLQPEELLGLYAYVKKVSIPCDQCGARPGIDGTALLRALPESIPSVLVGDPLTEEWYLVGQAATDNLSKNSESSLVSGLTKKTNVFTTTVSAGNAIHFSCHRTARQADRNHPKAPKSEWEGAILRNNRVNCNVILPLVSSRSSKVPLIAVDSALTEHQASVSNLLGSTPKSMLWTVLHDVRLLLLRIAYGEALNSDCGGGSLASNCQLMYYQMLMADMFDKDAQVDQPSQSQHARGLPAGFLAACAMLSSSESSDTETLLVRGIADAAPMAALNSVVFHNGFPDHGESTTDANSLPYPKRQWQMGKDYFLRGLLICAGRRHALGVDNSGCQGRGARARSSSLSDWGLLDGEDDTSRNARTSRATSIAQRRRKQAKPSIEDFQFALRPLITLYVIMDQLSSDFTLQLDDLQIEENAQRLVRRIDACRSAKNIYELLQKAELNFTHDEIIDLLQRGMVAA